MGHWRVSFSHPSTQIFGPVRGLALTSLTNLLSSILISWALILGLLEIGVIVFLLVGSSLLGHSFSHFFGWELDCFGPISLTSVTGA